MIIDPDLTYQCLQCGRSCTGWNVGLEESLVETLRELPITLRVIQERGQAFEKSEAGYQMYRPQVRSACGYLDEQQLCSIHSQLGYSSKPTACRQFPFLFTRLPQGSLHVSASFCCTSVRQLKGPKLPESREEISALLARDAIIQHVPEAHWPDWDFDPNEDEQMRELLLRNSSAPEMLAAIEQIGAFSLLKPCLYDHDRNYWQEIDRAVMEDGDLSLPEFGWQGPVRLIRERIAALDHQFEPAIRRYRNALWFRKAHLLAPNRLAGLLLLLLVPKVLKLLTVLSSHQAAEVTVEHFEKAQDAVEMSLVAHSSNGGLAVAHLSRFLHHA